MDKIKFANNSMNYDISIQKLISELTVIKNQYVPSYMPQHRDAIDKAIEILAQKEEGKV